MTSKEGRVFGAATATSLRAGATKGITLGLRGNVPNTVTGRNASVNTPNSAFNSSPIKSRIKSPIVGSPASTTDMGADVRSGPERIESPVSSDLSQVSVSSITSDEASALSCPICQESMVTLLQLNRHLDDVHSEKSAENEQVKSWFKKKVEKARQIHSVNNILQHSGLGKLDLFVEDGISADNQSTSTVTATASSSKQSVKRTDENVTRKHWQKPSGRDYCSDPVCDKLLNARNGSINCRHCGKLFCNEHTMYQMKLSKNAKHSPQRGVWCRVCETCYKTRRGYSDNSGMVKDLTQNYFALRQPRIDIKELEVNKLEKRAVTLIKELATYGNESGLLSYGRLQQRKNIERQAAIWEDEKMVDSCRICQQKFGYLLRKHHCRICGQVVCADLTRDCSRDVQLSILAALLENEQNKLPRNARVSIRMCFDCKHKIFMKRNFERDLNQPLSQLLRLFDSFSRVKNIIELNLPKFQALLSARNDPEFPPPHATIEEASAVRKKLLDSFVQCDNLSRKILSYHATTNTEKRLQKQIYSVATQYLQERMLPLKTLPHALKHGKQPSVLSEVSNASDKPNGRDSTGNETAPSPVSPKPVTEELMVLEEQKFLVTKMIEEAKSKRRFDELGPLEASLTELQQEIDRLGGHWVLH